MSKPSQLCSLCQGITVNALSIVQDLGGGAREYGLQHYATFHDLLKSATTCAMCVMIATAMQSKSQIIYPNEDVINDVSNIRLVGFPLAIQQPASTDANGNTTDAQWIASKLTSILVGNASMRGWLSIYTQDNDPAAESIDGRPLGMAPNSDTTISCVKGWLSTCIANHPQCGSFISGDQANENIPVMPTYVVDVGAPGDAPKLLKTKDGIQGQYAALSHVWGTGQYTTQTIQSNVVHAQQAIDLASKQSKTLSDAIDITRALGLPYLWVDSLCIVQDGPGFDAQCDLMGQIYENATVTIAAAGAANDLIGCYIPRPRPKLTPVQFLSKQANGGAISHFFVALQTGRLENTASSGVWASRAWILQERVISRRIVYYAGDQVYWECLAMTRSEDGSALSTGNPKRLLYGTLDTQLSDKTAENMLSYSRFCQLVAEYTQRQLSRPEDVLDAIAGIKQEIITKTGGTYLAGHWKDYLQIGLLWQARSARLEIPDTPVAPTWSWASRRGPVFHDPYLFNAVPDEQYSIVSASVTPQKEDVHGKVYSGGVTLQGRMRAVVKMEGAITQEDGTAQDDDTKKDLWSLVSSSIHAYDQDRSLLSALVEGSGDGTLVGWGSFDTVDESHSDTDTRAVTALCVSKNMPPGGSPTTASPQTPTFNVLLLQRQDSNDTANLNYVRVGMGEITTDLWFDDVKPMAVTLV